MMLFLISSVNAESDLLTNMSGYFRLDETSGDVIDSHGTYDGTNYGATRGVTAFIDNGFDYDGDDDYTDAGGTYDDLLGSMPDDPHTIAYLIEPDNVNNNKALTHVHEISEDNKQLYINRINDGKLQFYMRDDDSAGQLYVETDDILSADNKYLIVFAYDGSNSADGMSIHVNGEAQDLTTLSDDPLNQFITWTSNAPLAVAKGQTTGTREYNDHYDGLIDEAAFWKNRELTDSEVSELDSFYDDGESYPFERTEITAKDSFTDDSINTFNATITNSTDTTTFTTTNGTIEWPYDEILDITIESSNFFTKTYENYNISGSLEAELHNLVVEGRELFGNATIDSFQLKHNGSTFSTNNGTLRTNLNMPDAGGQSFDFDIESTGYYSRSYSWPSNETLVANLWQAYLYVEAREKYTNMTIDNFNVTGIQGNASQFNTSEDGNATLLLNEGSYNLTAEAEDYEFNATDTVDLGILDNQTILLEFTSNELNVTAVENFSQDPINNFTVQLRRDDLGILYNVSTTDGLAQLYGVEGDYEVTIFTEPYADETIDIELINTSQNYQFELYTTNSILFEFYDEVSGDPINDVTTELISEIYSNNYSTSNGSLYLDLLSPAEYTIRSRSEGYTTRLYEHTLSNNTNTHIDIYLINESNSNYMQIPISVIDQNMQNVPGATVKLMRFDLAKNAYTIREIARTDFEGVASLGVVQFDEFYRIVIEHNGEIKYSTEQFQINRDSYTFQIVIGDSFADSFFSDFQIYRNIRYDYENDMFRFEYSDSGGEVTEACIEVYETDVMNGSEKISENCVTGSAGILYSEEIEPKNGTTYRGMGFLYYGNKEQYVGSETVSFTDTPGMGVIGILAVLLFTLLFLGLWISSSEALFLIMLPLPTVIGSMIGWIDVEFGYALGLEIVAIIVAIFIYRRRS
ncbi:MAG: hypothetical protein ACLFTR_03435 [Candidatus Woesearchaeota archaeon]